MRTRNIIKITVILFLISGFIFPSTAVFARGLFDFSARRMEREFQAGIALLQRDEYDLAARQFQNFLNNYEDTSYRVRVKYGLGEAHYARDHYDTALGYYTDALKKAPLNKIRTYTAVERGLRSARRVDNYDSGQEIIAFLEQNPDSYTRGPVYIPEEVARFHLHFSEQDYFRDWAKKYRSANPENDTWTVNFAALELETENYSRVVELTGEILEESGPHLDRARFLQAEANYLAGNYEAAYADYQQLVNHPEYGPPAVYGIAWINIEQGELKEARPRLEELAEDTAVRIRGKAYRDLARLNRELKNPAEAIEAYENAVDLLEEPAKTELKLEFGDYLLEQGEDKRAVELYETAEITDPEINRYLIRAHAAKNNYDSVALRLNRLSEEEQNLPEWRYYRALVEYNRENYAKAVEIIPGQDQVDENLKIRLLRLTGAVNRQLNRLEEAAQAYEEWLEKDENPEASYYRARVDAELNKAPEARRRWQELLEKEPPSPWLARAAFQLSRLAVDAGEYERFDQLAGKVNPEELTAENRLEYSFLQFRRRRAVDAPDTDLLAAVKESKKIAEETNQKENWIDFFLREQVEKNTWEQGLVPVVTADENLINSRSIAVVSELKERGWWEFAIEVVDEFLAAGPEFVTRRQLLLAQMNILARLGRYGEIINYIPREKEWNRWSGPPGVQLALNISRYYRATEQPEEGLQKLIRFKDRVELPGDKKHLVREWKASLAINAAQYKRASEWLEKIDTGQITFSGRLNRSIVDYYKGKPRKSLDRLQGLHEDWDSPPVEFYEHGFRVVRRLEKDTDLVALGDEFMSRHDFSETEIVELQLSNVQYWNYHENYERSLRLLNRLEKLPVGEELKIPVLYQRAVALYNADRLEESLTAFADLRRNFELDSDWRYEVSSIEVEINLRQDRWMDAYDRWQVLDDIGRGGETGLRLLNTVGVKQAPDVLEHLLERLAEDYPDHLPEGENYYWLGRLRQNEADTDAAIEKYENYIQLEEKPRLENVRRRLAGLYESEEDHERAFEQYKALVEETGVADYRLAKAIQLRRLGRFEEAANELKATREELPEQLPLINYQLAGVRQNQARPAEAFKLYHTALEEGSDTEAWFTDAQKNYVRIGLDLDRLAEIRQPLSRLEPDPESDLFRLEVTRRQDSPPVAREKLKNYKEEYSPGKRPARFKSLALAIYWANEDYEPYVELAERRPEAPEDQYRLLASLLELEKEDEASGLYHRMPGSAAERGARLLGDYHYERKQWQPAGGYYREAAESIHVLNRLARVELQRGNYEDSYDFWRQLYDLIAEKKDRPGEIVAASIEPLAYIVDKLENYGEAAELFMDHRGLLKQLETSRFGELGFRWALLAGEEDKIKLFSDIIQTYPAGEFADLAARLEEKEAWEGLSLLVDRVDSKALEIQSAYDYYARKTELENDIPPDFPELVNRGIDRAVEEESVYGPRLQRLLADYYYQAGDYEQAAVEYHKVWLVFEDNDQEPPARLGLARSYDRQGLSERARSAFETIVEGDYPEDIIGVARDWLEDNS